MGRRLKGKATLILVFLALSMLFLFLPTASAPADERTYVYSSRVVYTPRGGSELTLDRSLQTFNIFVNTSWQTVYLLTTNRPYVLTEDSDGNPAIVLDVPPISPGENITLSYSLRIVSRGRSPPSVSFQGSGDLSDIPQALREEYCEAEGSWPVENETLRALASTIWAERGRPEKALVVVTALADWVGRNIRAGDHDVPYYPGETYDAREGDCDDQANLLITLCRTLGVPAYLQIGGLRSPGAEEETYWEGHVTSSLKGISYHGWAVVYVPPWGWLPFDMTLAWSASDPLSVVTSAPLWSLDTVQILNVTESDWAGEGRRQREAIVGSRLYLFHGDELVVQTRRSWWDALVRAWPLWATVIAASSVAAFLGLRRKSL